MTRQIKFSTTNLNSGSPYTTTTPNTTIVVHADSLQAHTASTDGEQTKFRSMKYIFRLFSQTIPYSVMAFVVQTTGTITSAVIATNHDVEDAIASQCNQNFGYQKVADALMSTHNIVDPTTPTMNSALGLTITIPKNIINVLNKIESESENRDQLDLVLIIQTADINNIGIVRTSQIEFDIIRQPITIR